jgi:hypothetical protein
MLGAKKSRVPGSRIEHGNAARAEHILQPEWPADKVERRAVAALIPYARNARTHSPEQVDQIAASSALVGTQAFGSAIVSAAQICEPVFLSLLDRSEASRKARMAAITRLETRIAAGRGIAREERTGNAAQYQASVNSVSGDQYLYLDANGRGPQWAQPPRRAAPPPFSGGLSRNFCMRPRGMFGARLPAQIPCLKT